MSSRNFRQLLGAQWARGNFVCVGLDSEYSKIPESARVDGVKNTIVAFNRAIVRATNDLVCAYKLNTAFYFEHGIEGLAALAQTVEYIQSNFRNVPVIIDAKLGDIGNTAEAYARFVFNGLGADAITVNPYLGADALEPFLERKEKGIFILCHTSNPGAIEFQDLNVGVPLDEIKYFGDVGAMAWSFGTGGCFTTLYNHVAYQITKHWNKDGNCGIVVGATDDYIKLLSIRKIVGDMPILIPGIGAQGGDVEKVVLAGEDSRGQGMIINSSRGIIFASKGADFAEAARRETKKLHDKINWCRQLYFTQSFEE